MADSTIMLTRVNVVKRAAVNFAAVDAGFNALARPMLYDSYHHILPVDHAEEREEMIYTIVGPICESGDILARDRPLPRLVRGISWPSWTPVPMASPWPLSTMASRGRQRSWSLGMTGRSSAAERMQAPCWPGRPSPRLMW